MYCCPGCHKAIDDSVKLFDHLRECNQDEAKTLLSKGEESNDPKDYQLIP
ncbi:hypothetical protein J2X83_005225 [Brevibacillus nitrificans]|nr:hypothetical protein [Brevibacillus nitrificans]